MNRINLVKLESADWIKYRFDLIDQFQLNSNEVVVYGYIYRYCSTYHPFQESYWIGFSNERMAKECRMKLRTFERVIASLEQKKLIVIANPGKRSKRTGQSRMIYLNHDIFINELQMSISDVLVDEKEREIQRLKAQIDQLQKDLDARPRLYPNIFLQQIIDSGYISDADVPRACVVLNPGYELLAKCFHEEVQKHVTYMIRCLDNAEIKPSDTISYLSKALVSHFQYLHAKRYNEPYTGKITG